MSEQLIDSFHSGTCTILWADGWASADGSCFSWHREYKDKYLIQRLILDFGKEISE